jgi:hypothetical protein
MCVCEWEAAEIATFARLETVSKEAICAGRRRKLLQSNLAQVYSRLEVCAMGMVAMRSFFCGVAGAVMSVPLLVVGTFAWMWLHAPHVRASQAGGGQVGWDVGSMWHNADVGVWMLSGFAIGFLLGWWNFSKGRPSQTA